MLFATPFVAVGAFVAVAAVRSYLNGAAAQQVLVLSAAAIAFGGAGLFILGSALRGGRMAAASDALQAQHPSEPWMWKGEWASRRVPDHAVASTAGMWAGAVITAAVIAPGLILAPHKSTNYGAMLFFAAFGLVVLFLLVSAIRATLQARRFHSVLVLDTLPGAIGGALRAHAEISGDTDALRNAQAIRITLTSLRRQLTQSGKSSSTSDTILWQDTSAIAGSALGAGPSGAVVPVEFVIPADATPTDDSNYRDQTLWRVNIDADVPGVDYAAHFWVPVFRTAAAPMLQSAPVFHAQPSVVVRTIPEQQTPAGLRLDFKPFRAPALAIGTSAFTVIWLGAVALMVRVHAPFFLIVVFAAIGLIVAYASARLLFGSSTVTVTRDSVLVEPRVLIKLQPKTIPRADITGVQIKIREQTSSGTTATAYYDVELLTRDGRSTVLGSLIRDKAEAERLAGDVRGRLQLS